MRVRFPLAGKILGWFFLNLILLALIALLIGQQKMRFGLDSLVAGPRGDRLRALAVLVIQEFNQKPRAQWNETLEKFGGRNGVQLALFAMRGNQLAGGPLDLPEEVRVRLNERPPPENRPPHFALPPPPNERPTARDPDIIGLVRARSPSRYWVVMHAPLPQLGAEGPAALVVRSDSLSAGGLIFDYAPLLWAIGAAVIVSALFWLPLVKGITRSLAEMRAATARIAEGNFEQSLSVHRRDELGALALSINRMSERLAGLLQGQRRFLGDVAHELCAPLSRLQMALGILETQVANAAQLDDVREEVDQISALVHELLSFSRASLGSKKLQLRAMELRPLLEEAARRENATVQLDCAALSVVADHDLLLRAVSNLLRNSVRYAGEDGPIEMRAAARNGEVKIEIIDQGPGIPGEALAQIFDPFHRLDTSRTRETGGVGLGLTIAKTCVEAMGGQISLQNNSPRGLRATIHLRSDLASH